MRVTKLYLHYYIREAGRPLYGRRLRCPASPPACNCALQSPGQRCDVGSNADNPPTLEPLLALIFSSRLTLFSDYASSCVLHSESILTWFHLMAVVLDARRPRLARAFYSRTIHDFFIITAIVSDLLPNFALKMLFMLLGSL